MESSFPKTIPPSDSLPSFATGLGWLCVLKVDIDAIEVFTCREGAPPVVPNDGAVTAP